MGTDQKKEFLKIWFEDIQTAEEYFEGNAKHLGEFLLNVYRVYAELPTQFTSKVVEKYFKTYQKYIGFVKESKKSGKNGWNVNPNNQSVNTETLKGSLEGPLNDSLNQKHKVKSKKHKVKSKIDIHPLIDLFNNIFETNFTVTTGRRKELGKIDSAGFSEEDIRAVFEFKKTKWGPDEKMKQYLTPDTLLRFSNVEKYIEEVKNAKNGTYQQKKQANEPGYSGDLKF